MKLDTVVKGGHVLLASGEMATVDIAIAGGKIAAIASPEMDLQASNIVNAQGLVVMPGVIDVHLHLGHGNDISRPRVVDDARSETFAAAAGGVTTFIPYLMSSEPFEDGVFAESVAVVEAGSLIDFGYHLIIATEDQLGSVPRYIEEFGAPSFKIFMNNRGNEGARLGLPDIDDGFLFRLAELCAANGGLVCPHPENIEIAWVLRDRLKASDPEGQGGLAVWNEARPDFIEADAVNRVALVCRATGAPLYVVHCSSEAALKACLAARELGVDITIETCPHYLTHDVDWAGGDVGKINPPLRNASDREALWQAIARGEVDTIATDHVHRTLAGKAGGIWNASPGCPGMETLLPVMLSEGYHNRGISLLRISNLLSAAPAQKMGLKNKGSIAIGMDADLVLVDLERRWTVKDSEVRSNAGYSIYNGVEMQGAVHSTLVRGQIVVENGKPVEAAFGTGRYQYRNLRNE